MIILNIGIFSRLIPAVTFLICLTQGQGKRREKAMDWFLIEITIRAVGGCDRYGS